MSTREITLEGGLPWGFRMHGGIDVQLPLKISRVNPGSKATQKGIREGDLISSINGQSTHDISNSEAHSLLRNAGNTLTLGLNQGNTGSPKRRSQRIVEESKVEITKRTSGTNSSNISTAVNNQQNNEAFQTNDPCSSNSETERYRRQDSSNFSSYIKNGTSSRGTANIQSLDDIDTAVELIDSNGSTSSKTEDDTVIALSCTDKVLLDAVIMADNVNGSSRSRKQRKSRTNRKKVKNTSDAPVASHSADVTVRQQSDKVIEIATDSTLHHAADNECDNSAISSETYRVESPKTVASVSEKKSKSSTMVKSRSLDDDDQVKIMDVTEDSVAETIDKCQSACETIAIVSEAESVDSDVEWEVVSELPNEEQHFGKLSIISLPLEEHRIYETTHISPEDERSLRDFLEGLNLINSPEESVKRIEKSPSPDNNPKARKAKKRAALAQHFLPYYEYPRYLDVISEEGSDLSDRDNKQITVFKKHISNKNKEEFDYYDDDDDDVFEDNVCVKEMKLRSKFQDYFVETKQQKDEEEAVLVGTKLVDCDIPNRSCLEGTWSKSMAETRSGAEVVYLEDSSNSMTPNELLDQEDAPGGVDADDEDDMSLDLSKSFENNPDLNSSETNSILKSEIPKTFSSDAVSCLSLPSDEIKSEPVIYTNDNHHETTKYFDNFLEQLELTLINKSSDIHLLINSDEFQNLPTDLREMIKNRTKSANEMLTAIQAFKERNKNEDELNKELKLFLDVNECTTPNASRPNSASSACSSSSRSTSRCTVFYNPIQSSLTNIVAMLHDGDDVDKEPNTLREICVKALLSMPFGKDIIEELANVSSSIEEMTNKTPSFSESNSNISNHCKRIESVPNIETSSILPVDNPVVTQTMDHQERWTGMRTDEDPNLLVCLSPSQKSFIDTTKTIPNEADKLLDLHRKYIERRGYHEQFDVLTSNTTPAKSVPTYQIKIEPQNNGKQTDTSRKSNNINYNNYIKQFTQEIPKHTIKSKERENEPGSDPLDGNIRYDKYIKQITREVPIQVEKQINKPVNNKIYHMSGTINEPGVSDRLNARHLSEWLNLARSNQNLPSSSVKLIKQRSCCDVSTDSTTAASRRHSLPVNFYEQEMESILEKEREIMREIEKLRDEENRLEENDNKTKQFDAGRYQISRKGDIAILNTESEKILPKLETTTPVTERFRQEMYNEYMCKVAERLERKQNKVLKIKITEMSEQQQQQRQDDKNAGKHPVTGIEDEFMIKVKERMDKLGLETNDSNGDDEGDATTNSSDVELSVLVMDGTSFTNPKRLPKHLQEFVDYARTTNDDGVWAPGHNTKDNKPLESTGKRITFAEDQKSGESTPVVWTPRSAGSSPTVERKEFRPVNFESPVLGRKNAPKETDPSVTPPWEGQSKEDVASSLSTSLERRLTTSQSAPVAGLNNLSKLPRAQNPTITLLQKAREGQLPRGASYIEEPPQIKIRNKNDRPPLIGPNEILYTVKNEYMSESDSEKPKKMADLGSRKFDGIGPTTKDGMPIVLRSEVKDSSQAKWYKRMYDTLHRTKNDDESVQVRYKTRRGRYPYTSHAGYLSEPEPNAYDSDYAVSANKYATLDRRRYPITRDKENEYITYTVPRNKYMSASVRHSTDVYKNQPGRIEHYVPGHSSISEKEAKEWWDEVMEIFDGWLDDHSALPSLNYMLSQVTTRSHLEQQKHVPPPTKSYMNHALKESGYESDSQLVFRRREDAALQLNPQQQKEAYKSIQRGGEVPLHGLRKLAPERPKEDDSEMEYFPLSPTLTRIRVHKNIKPINEIFCYPLITHYQQPPDVFSTYKRTAPSSSLLAQPPRPPSPPKRRSSRNSHTLKLISTMTIRTHSPKSSRRHETCFTSSTNNKSNVRYLRDKISCKLKTAPNSSNASNKKLRVTKTISTCPSSSKESIATTVSSLKGSKIVPSKITTTKEQEKQRSRNTSASNTFRRCCRHCSFSVPPKIDTSKSNEKTKPRCVSLERTFGTEKRKVDLVLPKVNHRYKLVKSPDLTSPTEVKKGVQNQKDLLSFQKKYPPGTTIKKSTALFASAKNGTKGNFQSNQRALNVTVAMTEQGKAFLKSAKLPTNLTVRSMSNSPVPSNASDKSKLSYKSYLSDSQSARNPSSRLQKPESKSIKKSITSTKEDIKTIVQDKNKIKNIKKNQSNEELKKEKKNSKFKENKGKILDKLKAKRCAGRAAGTEILKKLKKIENSKNPHATSKGDQIKETRNDMSESNSFFQHLFLRNILTRPVSLKNKSLYITEKAQKLQNNKIYPESSVGALKLYLSHRKPVSESKFRVLDREIMRSRSVSPPTLIRSYSEHTRKFDSITEISNEDSLYGSRSSSPGSSRRSTSLPITKYYFSETSRPISPVCDKYRRRVSPSPSPIRSPSMRKIHTSKSPATITVEGISGIKRKTIIRSRSAGEAESVKRKIYNLDNRMTPSISSVSLSQITDPRDYKMYVTELRHSTQKCDRFRELNRFYSSLERLGKLEYATSSTDLRPRRRNEDEIIDYDRWKEVRSHERATQEFDSLLEKLKKDQKEKDLLFRIKDVENIRWKRDHDIGLRVKELSVENIKEQFENLKQSESITDITKKHLLNYQKEIYKPLWRGNSVLNLVSKIGERRSQSESRATGLKQKMYTERLLTREFGSTLWSSLSVEQVSTLKNQLAEIYSQTPPKRKSEDFSITVNENISRPNNLVIRRNSANELSGTEHPKIPNVSNNKSLSIGSMTGNQSLTEDEKKRLSMSLSREVQERMSQKQKYRTSLSIILGKETRGAIAAADANTKSQSPPESMSPRTCYSLEATEDGTASNKQETEKNFIVVLTKDESEEQKQNVRQTLEQWAQPKQECKEITVMKRIPSTSETESAASSETSTKTAIFIEKKDDLQKKIEYFETGANAKTYIPTIHRPAEGPQHLILPDQTKRSGNLSTSQSYADLKELFGEKELMKFATVPLSATRKRIHSRKPLLRITNMSPIRTVSEASSCDSLNKIRSISPDTERFWNAYLTLVRGVDVRKLTEKFEASKDYHSRESFVPSHRRCRSDPELNTQRRNEFGDVYWLRKRYENIGRGRSRTRRGGRTSPISRIPLRVDDRLMPHINIISKLASLYPKKSSSDQHRSAEILARELGCPVGEVEKLREKFESSKPDISLLGHMFTSSPNVHELRDIAPYLAGSWIAHQYPRFEDNTRSLSAPDETNVSLVRRDYHRRPKSVSPSRICKQPSSILKSHQQVQQQQQQKKDVFANQHFDPNIHRPTYRYQPLSPSANKGRNRSWSPTAKHTVTFKEPELGPIPPPKGLRDNKDIGSESPRKYVDDEVTIHYRSPVRHEIKEMIGEEELARRQAEAMRRIYQEERRRKYLQELQDMNNRRHTDNFIPSQKSPISLNRYDDFVDDLNIKTKPRERSPEPRLVARALYNFVGQSSRELTFRKGDIIFIRRQVDKNWYEGEHNAMLGLFPFNYVEIIPYDGIKSTPRKAHEGQARAKFNFIAQTNLELSLAKGELVVLTRRIDDNWYEGRIGSRKGIFPVAYVDILIDPSDKQEMPSSVKPVASPAAHSLLLNGTASGKESMGSHHYQPPYSGSGQQTASSYHAKPVHVIGTSASYSSLPKSQKLSTAPAINEALHIDTHSEPIPYRALYKYRPQNDDELELLEGDTVYVLEKCDDGWYVGSSQRTGAFGTFPGNYVERI